MSTTQDHQHDHQHDHQGDAGHDLGSRSMAVSATLHCLTGCAIGEIVGLLVGTALGLATLPTVVLSVALAFVFGFTLSSLPLVRAGLGVLAALGTVVAADTVSIATMEVVDNLVMALLPGAMGAGLVNSVFWIGMTLSLAAAFVAALPVNRWLLARGKGHALTHRFHGAQVVGRRRWIPDPPTSTLVAVIAAFILGGLVVSVADELGAGEGAHAGAAPTSVVGRSHAVR